MKPRSKLVQDVGFDYSFSFLYSPRPGTPAAFIKDDTPQESKLARLSKLQTIIEAQGDAISRNMLGTTQRVLIDGTLLGKIRVCWQAKPIIIAWLILRVTPA